MSDGTTTPLLEVSKLGVSFRTSFGRITPVSGLDLRLEKGETLGIVGESGCGKTVTAFSTIGLLPRNAELAPESRIAFAGEDIARAGHKRLELIRGDKISMIFQEPMTSLNPVFTVGDQIAEVYRIHRKASRSEARERALGMMKLVRIPEPEKRLDEYPHRLSGGMRQRVMIAMALACKPDLLVADEPTTALDVTIQAQVLELMRGLKDEFGTSIMMITHDLGVVAETCQRVLVMYAGLAVEEAPVEALFAEPAHPYTVGLLESIPNVAAKKKDQAKLRVIPGTVPPPNRYPGGCRFHPRCARATERCAIEAPPLFVLGPGRSARCWLVEDRAADAGGRDAR